MELSKVIKAYKNLRKKTESIDLEREIHDVFESDVTSNLRKEFKPIDQDAYAKAICLEEPKMTARSCTAEYSIDIEADGYVISIAGFARLNTNYQYSTQMKAYRIQEVGSKHDFIDYLNVTAYDSKEIVDKIIDKVMEIWDKATEED